MCGQPFRFHAPRLHRFASTKHVADSLAGEYVGLGWNFEQIDPAQAFFDRLLAVLHQALMAQQTVALDLSR
jgi:hypothetical protein